MGTVSAVRELVAAHAVAVALVLQVTVFPHLAFEGIVPNLCLLVVVGAALTRGPQFSVVPGSFATIALALALVVVGWLAGRMRQDVKPTATTVVATVAASSFVGTSIFAISGLVLRDPALGVPDLLRVILVAVVWDVLLTPFVLPLLMRMFHRLEPARTA